MSLNIILYYIEQFRILYEDCKLISFFAVAVNFKLTKTSDRCMFSPQLLKFVKPISYK